MSDLALRVRSFGGFGDVEALLAAYAGVASVGPVPPVDIPPPPDGLSGQTGIRMREALATGDAATAASLACSLDPAHAVELLLGAALRDRRGDWAAARLWLAADARDVGPARWWPVCRLLAEPGPDHTLDELAAAYVAEGLAPDVWRPAGRPLDRAIRGPYADVIVAQALRDGVAGDALLDAFANRPLYAAVAAYYRRGSIHALGVRPLLILAASTDV